MQVLRTGGVSKLSQLDIDVPTIIRDAIVNLPDTERKIVITNPKSGNCRVISICRNGSQNVEYTYDDVPKD